MSLLNSRCSLVPKDGELTAHDSSVFADMLDAASPLGSDQKPIDMGATAIVVAAFLDLMLHLGDLKPNLVQLEMEDTCKLIRLARKFEAEELVDAATSKLEEWDVWDVLKHANDLDDVEIAREALRHVKEFHSWHTRGKVDLKDAWRHVAMLKPAWQFALLRCYMPSIDLDKDPQLSIRVRGGGIPLRNPSSREFVAKNTS